MAGTGVGKQWSKEKSGGDSRSETTVQLDAASPQEQAIRDRFASLGMNQADAVQFVLESLRGAGGPQLQPLSGQNLDLLNQAYSGANADLLRQANLMKQDLAGTRGLNGSDTPVSDAVIREFAPQFANLASAKANQGLGLSYNMANLGEMARQFNIGGILTGASTQPTAGLSLMNSLQADRFKKAGTTNNGGTYNWNQPSPQQMVNTESETFRNVGQGVGGFAAAGASDERLKRDIVPVQWNWKDGGESHIGVIAQEVQHSHPHLVMRHPEEGYLMVDYGTMVAMLLSEREWLYERLNAAEESSTDHPSQGEGHITASAVPVAH